MVYLNLSPVFDFFSATLWASISFYVIASILFSVAERLLPLNAPQSPWGIGQLRWRKFFLATFNAAISGPFTLVSAFGLAQAIKRLAFPAFSIISFPVSIQVLLLLLCVDLFYYFMHRFVGHGVAWRFHLVHHAEPEVDWAAVTHPMDVLLSFVQKLTVFLFFDASPQVLAPLIYCELFQNTLVHTNLYFSSKYLNQIYVTPQFHRVHHQLDRSGQQSNFGVIFPFWDRLFNTFQHPARPGSSQQIGFIKGPHTRGIWYELVAPFHAPVKDLMGEEPLRTKEKTPT